MCYLLFWYCSGEQHRTQLLNVGVPESIQIWLGYFGFTYKMSSFAGGHVTENLNLRPFFSCCPGFLFQNWLEDIICCRTLFFCCCGFFSITLEINHLDTVKLSTVDWCPTRLQQIWSLCCRTLIMSEINPLKWQFLLVSFHYKSLFE